MIISRAPLRLTFGGGGSDLAPDGVCVTATIDKYVAVMVSEGFDGGYLLHYKDYEHAETVDEVRHPLIRQALGALDVPPNVQISSMADIPAGTGLGSSGSFTVALLHALSRYVGLDLNQRSLARLACQVDGTGWQDQFSAVYGGVRVYTEAENRPLKLSEATLDALDGNLRLFYTGIKRDSADVLPHAASDQEKLVSIAHEAVRCLESGDMNGFAWTLTEQWTEKLAAHPSETHLWVEQIIGQSGALGGKLVGAGDGGFILLYKPKNAVPLREVPFSLAMHEVQ